MGTLSLEFAQLSHASGDGVSMAVWDEENTHHATSNPGKTRDTVFLGEDETGVGGVYSVAVNATMTENIRLTIYVIFDISYHRSTPN